MDWSKLQDASGDNRGRPATIDPALQAIKPGASKDFGPFASKGSAKTSMSNYSDRAAARGLLFVGPVYAAPGNGANKDPNGNVVDAPTGFYFRAHRPR